MRVLIAVTHLLGAGHLTRAAALARAFAENKHAVTLVSGGSTTSLAGLGGVTLVQLPPVHIAGTHFSTLLDASGAPVRPDDLARRRELLLRILETEKPDAVITELFPFGRRVLGDEFTALVDAARGSTPRPLILCSIRDILVAPSRPDRIEETHRRLLRDYDGVLVHGDPRLVPLEASWPLDERIRPLLHYTGYVDEGAAPPRQGTRQGIVVSGGSSPASLPLYRAALQAAEFIADEAWRILVGRGVPEAEFEALQALAPAHARVERARPDFRALLSAAELSVSQAGYNTSVDLLRSGVRPILVPFEAGHETEQRLRAERLKDLGLAEMVPESELSPQRLAEAIRHGSSRPTSPLPPLDLDGAPRSVAIVETLVRAAPAYRSRIDWSRLDAALKRAEDGGLAIRFWWRDDDAVAATPQLERLLALARRFDAGLALAAIPAKVDPSLARCMAQENGVFVLVHGSSHANHAPFGEKKAEFAGHRPLEALEMEAGNALTTARAALGDKLLPVFVPPWNRIAPDLIPLLPRLGYQALSTFRDRARAHPASGLLQINTHVDPIDWHGTRSLVEPDAIVAALAAAVERRIAGAADRDEPIGFLTHHLVHDEAIWTFCETLLDRLTRRGTSFLRADALFRNKVRIAVEV